MKLKRLTLHGFKSFADKTDFDFHDGLTGIIGPNGCGKSNVVDAMKWVLGDQRPTSQRGKEMLDVVFHGAEGRPAMGHAEVMLVLERDPVEIGAECDAPVEMTVGRRLFRSGESEYLLNGQAVRLKDIKEALMDTGLGVGGYSVMEQGRIDAVLSANPEERRQIFDEAAGISRYKLRRKEALRRLDKTELNLARVKDLRQEKASRLRSLKIQATRARNYRETSERLMALRIAVAMLDSIALRESLADVGADLERIEKDLRRVEADRDASRIDLAEVEDEARALADRHGELRDLAAGLRAEERSRREALETAEERIRSLGDLVERAKGEAATTRDEIARNATEVDELRRAEREIAACLDTAATDLERLTAEAREARRSFQETQRTRESVRSQLLDAMQERTRARNGVRDEELQGQALAARRSRLTGQLAELEARLEASRKEGLRDARIERDLAERAARAGARLEAHVQRLDDDEREKHAVVARRHALDSERSACASQLDLLADLEASHTGLDEAARELLESGDGAVGRLVEHVDAPIEVSAALEAVLGSRVQALVIRDFDRAKRALDALAERTGGGRLVLVDRTALPAGGASRPLHADVEDLGAGGTPLADFCALREPVAGLLGELLDGVRLVPDLVAARRLQASSDAPRTIVTLRGEVLEGAWLSGGSVEVAAGLVQRRASLDRLRERLAAIETELVGARAAEESLDAVLARRAAQRQRLVELGEAVARKRSAIELELRARAQREAELEAELESARAEVGEITAEKIASITRAMPAMLDVMLLGRRERVLEDEQRELDRLVIEQDRLVHSSQDALAGLQSRKAGLGAELTGQRERCDLLERSLEDKRRRLASLDEQAGAASRERGSLLDRIETLHGQSVDHGCRAAFVEELCKRVADQTKRFDEDAGSQRRAAAALDDELLRLRETRGETELKMRELAGRLARIDDEIRDAYRVDLARLRGEHAGYGLWTAAEIQGPPLPPTGDVRERVLAGSIQGPPLPPDFFDVERHMPRLWEDGDFDYEGTAREVEVLRSRMQRMGSVNLTAEAELAQVEQQFTQLENDCLDLEEARKQLFETLQRINTESRAMFETTFEQARANFQEIFRKLFQGGRADVKLVETEDPLDAGIDILARPPGKELRSIRLLSGGERSLTALAILFAVFQIKPSPFCILDEVDAALDEANVERFLRVLGDFVGDTQFLVVTHHKRTMAECSVLYGVTMPRKGISSRMSVSLEEVESGKVDDVLEDPVGRLPRVRARGNGMPSSERGRLELPADVTE